MNSIQQPTPNFNLPEPVDTQAGSATDQPVQAQVSAAGSSSAPVTGTQNYGDVLMPQQVQSVEQAVRQNMDDPRMLSLRLDEMRAGYIAGRFAKNVKRQGGGE